MRGGRQDRKGSGNNSSNGGEWKHDKFQEIENSKQHKRNLEE
jgi:hypothetical protein